MLYKLVRGSREFFCKSSRIIAWPMATNTEEANKGEERVQVALARHTLKQACVCMQASCRVMRPDLLEPVSMGLHAVLVSNITTADEAVATFSETLVEYNNSAFMVAVWRDALAAAQSMQAANDTGSQGQKRPRSFFELSMGIR